MSRVADGKWTTVRSAESVENHRLRSLAIGRAKQRLVKRHADEFAALVSQEREKVGSVLTPRERQRAGRSECTRCGLPIDDGSLCEFCEEWDA